MNCSEVWRPVVGYERYYEVSSLGRVRSLDRIMRDGRLWPGKLLSPGRLGSGHLNIGFQGDGDRSTRKHYRIHCVVLEAFVGPRPAGMQGCHNNGIAYDNRLENLRWDTPASNYADIVKHGSRQGLRNGRAKFNEVDVERICDLRRCGVSPLVIAKLFNRPLVSVARVYRRASWRHVDIQRAA